MLVSAEHAGLAAQVVASVVASVAFAEPASALGQIRASGSDLSAMLVSAFDSVLI